MQSDFIKHLHLHSQEIEIPALRSHHLVISSSAPNQRRDQSAASSNQVPMTLHAREEPPRDTMEEWDEIEKEERRVRAELTRALPGDPILVPIENLQLRN